MPLKPIEQSVYFSASPSRLFNLYLDSRHHSAFTGQPAKVSAKPGRPFSAFNGQLLGSTLATIPDQLIVQRWRSKNWKASDPDSILTLTFYPERSGCRIHLVHLNVPKHDHKGVTQGWPKYYWMPLRTYLKLCG